MSTPRKDQTVALHDLKHYAVFSQPKYMSDIVSLLVI